MAVNGVQLLIAGIAIAWVGGCLVIGSLYAPEAYVRGPMRAAIFLLGTAMFLGGIVMANW